MQHIETIERCTGSDFTIEVNELLNEGYEVQSSCISRRCADTYDEYSIFQAILLKKSDD